MSLTPDQLRAVMPRCNIDVWHPLLAVLFWICVIVITTGGISCVDHGSEFSWRLINRNGGVGSAPCFSKNTYANGHDWVYSRSARQKPVAWIDSVRSVLVEDYQDRGKSPYWSATESGGELPYELRLSERWTGHVRQRQCRICGRHEWEAKVKSSRYAEFNE